MQFHQASFNMARKQQLSDHLQKINQKSGWNKHISSKQSQTGRKNPEDDQEEELRTLVKQYMRGKNIEELKEKFYTERLVKRRNRASIELKKSSDLRKGSSIKKNQVDSTTNKVYGTNQYNESVNSHLSKIDQNHSVILNHYHEQSQRFKQCTCGAHYCQTNQIKIKVKDPVSKFQSNYTVDTKGAKSKSKSHMQRPEMTAAYYSQQLVKTPQYSPKFQTLNFDSSYKAEFMSLQPRDKLDSFKHLKLSNVKFGPKEVKHYQSSYQKQYGIENQEKYASASKTPQPFVVKESGNLKTLGVRYHSINSNYQKEFQAKKDGKRQALVPPSLFKDLNVHLIKESSYKQAYSPRTSVVRTSMNGRSQKEKYPIVHHLSSSFIPLDGVTMDSEVLNSSYKKDFSKDKEEGLKYFCPHGYKSSSGAISKH